MVGAFAFGFGYGTATVMFNGRFLIGFGARGPAMVSFVNAIFGIGAISAPLAFVAMGSQTGLAFAVVAFLALATVLVSFPLPASEKIRGRAAGRFRPHFGILALGMAAIAIEASLIGLGPVALIALGQSETQAATLLSGFFVSFLVIRLILAAFSNLIAPLNLLILALSGTGIACLVTVALSPATGFIALGACAGLFFPSYFVCATALMGSDARVTPTIISGGLVGGITSPLLIGLILSFAGETAFFWIVMALTLTAALIAFVFKVRLNPVAALPIQAGLRS